MVEGRGLEMATIFQKNPYLLMKLYATSMGLSLAVVKLFTYQRELVLEIKKDSDFYNGLRQAYIDSADEDKFFAEKFANVSYEVDKLALELTR